MITWAYPVGLPSLKSGSGNHYVVMRSCDLSRLPNHMPTLPLHCCPLKIQQPLYILYQLPLCWIKAMDVFHPNHRNGTTIKSVQFQFVTTAPGLAHEWKKCSKRYPIQCSFHLKENRSNVWRMLLTGHRNCSPLFRYQACWFEWDSDVIHKQLTNHQLMTKVCQILSRWTKNSLHPINIYDTVTKVLPSCSVYRAPSYEPNFALLEWFLSELAYLSMLFILEVVCRVGSEDHLKNK